MIYRLSKRINQNIVYIAFINIIIIILYNIVSKILEKWDLLFRGWIDFIYTINLLVLPIIVIVFIYEFLNSKLRNKVLKIIITLIVTTTIIIYTLYGFVFFALSWPQEHIVYEQNQKVIAMVYPIGLHETGIYFYEPVNIFFMRKSNLPSKFYEGSYDIYKKR